MNRMAAELERRWLDRYLNRELGTADRDWFESYLLDKPDLLVYLEADTALGDGLRSLAAQGELDALLQAPAARRTTWLPMLASGCAGVLVGAFATLLFSLPTELVPQASPPELLLKVSRSHGATTAIQGGNPGASLGVVSISLPPLATLDSVQWTTRDGVVQQMAGAHINREGMLILLLPREQIAGSSLTIDLTDEGESLRRQVSLDPFTG